MKYRRMVIVVIIFGIFFRFWQVAGNFHFMMDEERDALIFARVFRAGHIPLIGGSIPGGLYVGPVYTWISSILLFVFKYDYSRLGYVSAFISSLSLIFLYLAAKKTFGERVSLLALVVYSFSFLIVEFNKRYWPPTFAPSLFIIIWYALTISETRKRLSFIIISVCLIIGVQSDPSNVAIFFTVIIYYLFSKKHVGRAVGLFSVVVFSHLPLFIFEIRHKFFLTHALIKFLTHPTSKTHVLLGQNLIKLGDEIAKVYARIFYVGNRDIAIQFPPEVPLLALRQAISPWLLGIAFAIFIFSLFILIKNNNATSRFLKIYVLVMIVGIFCYNIFFPGYTYEWFFTVSLPVLVVLAGLVFSRLNDFTATFLIILFIIINSLNNLQTTNSFPYDKKIELLSFAKGYVGHDEYSLISLGKIYFYNGYRYLADQINFPPVKSYMDVYYEWLYPKSSAVLHPKKIVLMVNYSDFETPDFWKKKKVFDTHILAEKTMYPMSVFIIDNSSGWFNRIKYDYFK